MRSLLIVEDEFYEQVALQYELECLYPEQFDILVAEDGIRALSLCEERMPDILLVDLNIPGLSGLELIRTLNEHHFHGKILITTAHDDFHYVREAISLGVMDYLLKPLKSEQLKTAVDKCIQKLQEESKKHQKEMTLRQNISSLFTYVNTYLVRDILSGHAPNHLLRTTYGWPEDGALQLSILCWHLAGLENPSSVSEWITESDSLLQNEFYVLASPYEKSIVILIQSKTSKLPQELAVVLHTYARVLAQKVPSGSVTLSPCFKEYQAAAAAFSELQNRGAQEDKVLALPPLPFENQIFGGKEERTRLRQKFVQRLREHQVGRLVQFFKRKASNKQTYWAVVSVLMDAIRYYDEKAEIETLIPILQSDDPYPKLQRWLEQYELTGETEELSTEQTSGAIRTALELMNRRFGEDFSQYDIAVEIGLNPTYLSHLFKLERGKTFAQELSEIRIRHACQLLQDDRYSIEEIAARCGYNSKKYFLESFKRVKGLTLTQYLQTQV